MPSACESSKPANTPTAAATAPSQVDLANGNGAAPSLSQAGGFTEEDIDYELPKQPDVKSEATGLDNGECENKSDEDKQVAEKKQEDDGFIFAQDTSFAVKIAAPGMEPFELQVGAGAGAGGSG